MERKKDNRRKKSLRLQFVIMAALVGFVVFGLAISPLFEVRRIVISGTINLTDDEILATSGLGVGQNIFSFSRRNAAARIAEMPFVRDVTVSRQFPDNITINVTERLAIASVRVGNTGTYLLIDDSGMVLGTGDARSDLLVVTGIEPTHFAVGSYLAVDNPAVFNNILYLSRVFRRYDFMPDVMDFSNPGDIVLHKWPLDILFGAVADADRKVQYIQAIIEQFPVTERGYIYIRDVNARPRFGLIR